MGRLAHKIILYWKLTNPKIVALLVFTAFAAGIMGGGLKKPFLLFIVTLAVALCSMGARTTTNYIDRNTDFVMKRTKHRPIPSRKVLPKHALMYGLFLVSSGLLVSVPLGIIYTFFLILGLIDNIVVYNLLTKKKTYWNILLGAPSGGIPAFVGYVSLSGRIDLTGIVLAIIVMLWTPIHIWSLSIKYKSDYKKASIPMLPTIFGVKKSIRTIALTSVILALFTVSIPFLPGSPFGNITLISAITLGSVLFAFSVLLLRHPTKKNSWVLFKYTGIYLTLLFLLMAIGIAIK